MVWSNWFWSLRQKNGTDAEIPVRTILRLASDIRDNLDTHLYGKTGSLHSQPRSIEP
jgi:hypothetical protein